MLEKAIEKLEIEMKQFEKNRSIQRIGEFLLQQLSQNPEIEEKILNTEKTILKSLNEMEKEAKETIEESKRHGAVGVTLTDEEGFEIILKYFGIDGTIASTKQEIKSSEVKANKVNFDVSLNDFLK
jgi:hypothetical protein